MRILTREYKAYSGKLRGFCEISDSTRTGPSHDRPIEYTPKITANTDTNTAMSTRNDHAQRDPSGRFAAGGSGVYCSGRVTGSVKGKLAFGQC